VNIGRRTYEKFVFPQCQSDVRLSIDEFEFVAALASTTKDNQQRCGEMRVQPRHATKVDLYF
jgi:hypothetical protein